MRAEIDNSFRRIMTWEGGGRYHEVAGDAGGGTKWGVSQRQYPELNIEGLSRDRALLIFEDDYWNKVKADLLPRGIRHDVVDFAFNSGPLRAKVRLQRAANIALGHARIAEDGQIGPMTLAAVNAANTTRMLTIYRALRVAFLVGIVERRPDQGKFLYGWLRRANSP